MREGRIRIKITFLPSIQQRMIYLLHVLLLPPDARQCVLNASRGRLEEEEEEEEKEVRVGNEKRQERE